MFSVVSFFCLGSEMLGSGSVILFLAERICVLTGLSLVGEVAS